MRPLTFLPKQLHIVSWNVAGWIRTAEQVTQAHRSVEKYLDHHQVDILCLQVSRKVHRQKHSLTQEVKMSVERIGQALKPPGKRSRFGPAAAHLRASVDLPGWNCFFSPCTLAGAKQFNGVATFVRADLDEARVIGASARPFGEPELDDEGRTIVTDHGGFVLVNSYVPNYGEAYKRLAYKVRYQRALRKYLERIKGSGRPVIFLGDLNLCSRPQDEFFAQRIVSLPDLRAGVPPGCAGRRREAVSWALGYCVPRGHLDRNVSARYFYA